MILIVEEQKSSTACQSDLGRNRNTVEWFLWTLTSTIFKDRNIHVTWTVLFFAVYNGRKYIVNGIVTSRQQWHIDNSDT